MSRLLCVMILGISICLGQGQAAPPLDSLHSQYPEPFEGYYFARNLQFIPSSGERTKKIIEYLKSRHLSTLGKASSRVATITQPSEMQSVTLGSTSNIAELTISNPEPISIEKIKVTLNNVPNWIKVDLTEQNFQSILPNSQLTVKFPFSVKPQAPLDKEDSIVIQAESPMGICWKKTINVKTSLPTHYELLQNFPNPFNPTTEIGYLLPSPCRASLDIYDLLGRKVVNLINEQQNAGYHQATFDARKFASGMYVYRLIATDDQNNHHVFQKKMLIVK